jgi:hypothetical protein
LSRLLSITASQSICNWPSMGTPTLSANGPDFPEQIPNKF